MESLAEQVKRLQNGDSTAYAEIVRRFQDMAAGYAYARLRDFQLAEDAAQEAFLQAYRDIASLREPAAFPGRFRRITHKATDRIGRRMRLTAPMADVSNVAAPALTADAALINAEQREQALASVGRLPEPLRTATTLFYIGGHSQREIGEFLGVPVNTVKTRLHRARRRLTERTLSMTKDSIRENRPSRDDAFVSAAELYRAAAGGDISAITSILAERPELLHGRDRHGDTALAHAARHGHIDVARLLLNRGANASVARSGKDSGWSPLFWAVGWNARADMVGLLLDHDADVTARADHHGAADDSCLHYAARLDNNGQIVSLLLSRGGEALLAARCGGGDDCDDNYTPLHAAVKRGHGEIAQILLDHSAELDAFSAAGLGMADWLAERDVAPDVGDANGWTPLHWAVACGRGETVEHLLDGGAALDARDRYGRAPAHHAILAGADALTRVLVERGAPLDDFANAALGRAEAVASVGAQDAFGWTPLHWACRAGLADTARTFLERGADPNTVGSEGRPALFIAAYDARDLPSCEVLLEFGVDPMARDNLDCGILAYDVGLDIGRLLRERGATE